MPLIKKKLSSSRTKKDQRVQMADIARIVGVSSSTVSRALSGSPLVNEKTSQRVREAAQRYNYTVSRLAMELRSGTNNTIAVVVPYETDNRQSFSDPFFHAMIGSLADALTERGLEMLLVRLEAGEVDMVSSIVDGGRASGLILIGQWRQHEKLNALAARRVPFVVWGAHLPEQKYRTVGSDNVLGGMLAARHLLAQGCERIAFLGDRELPEVAQRYKGFNTALRRAKIKHPSALRVSVPFLAAAGRSAILRLIESGSVFDGVFACSDILAMAAIGSLYEMDMRVPEDIPVIGYDDVDIAAHFSPSLTTIHQPIKTGGKVLVDTLIDMVNGGSKSSFISLLPTELVVRKSTRSIDRH